MCISKKELNIIFGSKAKKVESVYSVLSKQEKSYLSGVEKQRAENAWHTAGPPFG